MIHARDVFKRTHEIRMRREQTMQLVTERCMRYILKCAEHEHTSCIYEVPEVVLGLPTYNLTDCVRFVQQQLERRGFKVSYIFPRTLIISWEQPSNDVLPPQPQHVSVPMLEGPVLRRRPKATQQPDNDDRLVPLPMNTRPVSTTATLQSVLQPPSTSQQPRRAENHASPGMPARQMQLTSASNLFVRSISELRPSGRFVLDLK
jgi:hypothetical protein